MDFFNIQSRQSRNMLRLMKYQSTPLEIHLMYSSSAKSVDLKQQNIIIEMKHKGLHCVRTSHMTVGIRHFFVTQVSVSYKFAPVHCVIFNPEVEHECLQTLCTSKADAPLNSSVVLVV